MLQERKFYRTASPELRQDLFSFLEWRKRGYGFAMLTDTEKSNFYRRMLFFRQTRTTSESWLMVNAHSIFGAIDGQRKVFHLDFYETAVGLLGKGEVLGTDGLFNCAGIAIKGQDEKGNLIFGLSHQHLLWKRDNSNIPQLVGAIGSRFWGMLFFITLDDRIIALDDREQKVIGGILETMVQAGIRCLVLKRDNERKLNVAELVTTTEGVGLQVDTRTKSRKQFFLSWIQIEEALGKLGKPQAVLSSRELTELL